MKEKMFDTLRYVATTDDGREFTLDPSTSYVTVSVNGTIMHYPVEGDIFEWMARKERNHGGKFIPVDLKGRILPNAQDQDTETD